MLDWTCGNAHRRSIEYECDDTMHFHSEGRNVDSNGEDEAIPSGRIHSEGIGHASVVGPQEAP